MQRLLDCIRPSRLILLLPFLLSPAVALAVGGGGGHQKLPLDTILWNMGVKILDFIVVIFVLYRVLAKPMAGYFQARAEAIRNNLDDLQSRRATADAAAAEYEDKTRNIDAEIERIRREARLEMDREKEKVLSEAHRTAQELIRHAEDTIKREFAKARADLHAEAARLSLEEAEKLITSSITDKDQVHFADDYIRTLGHTL
jgi:F-type H+-transporting ATPase subunit b